MYELKEELEIFDAKGGYGGGGGDELCGEAYCMEEEEECDIAA